MESTFSRFISPSQNLSPREEREEEKNQSHLTLFGRSRIWGVFLPGRRRAGEQTKLKYSEFSDIGGRVRIGGKHLGWSSQKTPHQTTR